MLSVFLSSPLIALALVLAREVEGRVPLALGAFPLQLVTQGLLSQPEFDKHWRSHLLFFVGSGGKNNSGLADSSSVEVHFLL